MSLSPIVKQPLPAGTHSLPKHSTTASAGWNHNHPATNENKDDMTTFNILKNLTANDGAKYTVSRHDGTEWLYLGSSKTMFAAKNMVRLNAQVGDMCVVAQYVQVTTEHYRFNDDMSEVEL